MLTSAEVQRMRIVAEQALPGTCVITNGSATSDGGGGYTEGFTARTGGTVACRIAPLAASETAQGQRISPDANYVITLPAETTIETDDRITSDGVTYNVTAVRDRSWEITRRVEAEQVT